MITINLLTSTAAVNNFLRFLHWPEHFMRALTAVCDAMLLYCVHCSGHGDWLVFVSKQFACCTSRHKHHVHDCQ